MQPTFRDLGVPVEIADALAARGIVEPFPIQAATLVDSLAGRDVCGRAPTGSGKTLAFGIAIAARKEVAEPHRPWGLVLVPTRELAAQTLGVVDSIRRHLPGSLKACLAVGGVSINPQMMALRGGADVVIGTPGRLLDLVDKHALDLASVSTLVLDEADRLLSLGFADELARLAGGACAPTASSASARSGSWAGCAAGAAARFATRWRRPTCSNGWTSPRPSGCATMRWASRC